MEEGREMNGSEADTSRIYTRDILHLAVCSGLRMTIILSLKKGKKSLGDLRSELEVSSTTAIHALRALEKNNITMQDKDKKYMLTKLGEIMALKLLDFSNAAEVLKKHERFWLEHDLSGIPEHLLEKIGWLKDSTIVEDIPTDIFKSHTYFLELIKKSKVIRGFSSIYHPEYPELIEELVNRKVDVEIIVTSKVFEKILETAKKTLKKILYSENFSLFVLNEEVKIAFTLTDSVLHIGLFSNDGTYDYNKDIISDNEKAISWGRLLYEHYFNKSKKVDSRI